MSYIESYKPGNDLAAVRDGTKVKGIDPTKDKMPALEILHDLVQTRINRWLAKPSEAKQTITIGSMLRQSDAPHTGAAVDLNELGFATTVDQVIAVLADLPKGKYGLGMPFQGDFFPPEDELTAKQAAATSAAAATPATPASGADAGAAAPAAVSVSGALQKFTSHTYKSSYDPGAKKWSAAATDEQGGAWKHLKSKALRDKIEAMVKDGYVLTIFPDNREHLHVHR